MKKQNRSDSAMSRRKFISTAASAVAAFSVVPRHVLGGPKFVAPSEKIGCIAELMGNAG
jgi:hypothetical protein